ncbi:MAG: hypothetical protein GF364_22820 [Candidatus Lokiarchaeota archaeon]|nr:hypothetical protein [Candidatus Lokiarchaeota archaeon]
MTERTDQEKYFKACMDGMTQTIEAKMAAIMQENKHQSVEIGRLMAAVENWAPRCDERHGAMSTRLSEAERKLAEHERTIASVRTGLWGLLVAFFTGLAGYIGVWLWGK